MQYNIRVYTGRVYSENQYSVRSEARRALPELFFFTVINRFRVV